MWKFEELKIAVAGTGYVGLPIVTLLSQNHNDNFRHSSIHGVMDRI